LNDKKGLSLLEKEANLINNGKTLPFLLQDDMALATGFGEFVFFHEVQFKTELFTS
jgi:hypothetical protein